jgi:hypothetical protein
MTSEIKMRMGSFKESDIKVYDENISRFSGKAVDVPPNLDRIWSKARKSSAA